MKLLFNSLLITVVLFLSIGTFANDNLPKATSVLHSEIVELIGKRVPMESKENLLVRVSFILNNQNELVILDVISKDDDLKSYIKNKLNYKKLSTKIEGKKQEIYTLPIKVNQ